MTNPTPLDPPTYQPTGGQPSPSTSTARPTLRRSGGDRLAGGVCGGLAEYSGIDSLLWRVGFVGLTIAGGAGVLVYLLLWVLMPPAPARPGEPVSGLEQLVQRMHAMLVSSGLTSPGQ
jgi:phage shock protein PspC (stress-responsive transcriptional regulator)